MKNPKLIAVLAISILAVIVAFQNTSAVEVRVLFFTVSMSRAMLIVVTFLCGATAGLLGGLWSARRGRRKAARASGARG
jgi:uncharacterized integral membrane protein